MKRLEIEYPMLEGEADSENYYHRVSHTGNCMKTNYPLLRPISSCWVPTHSWQSQSTPSAVPSALH